MKISRRNFLKVAAASGALATASGPEPALARGNRELPPQALGLLYDSTLCVGCKACVSACKRANDMPLEDTVGERLWETPLDLSGKTLNVIKVRTDGTATRKDELDNGFSYIKKSCMHCVDPSCVSVCPVTAMTKNPETGIVSYDEDACIGCRYCVASCPFGVPRFQYDTATPRIQKCQLCKHRLAEGKISACAEVCPTGATLFGPVEKLREEARRRLALTAGVPTEFPRGHVDDKSHTHTRKLARYVQRLYGDKEMGGTQMNLLAGIPFDKLGYPDLPERSYASQSETIQGSLYGGMILPIVALGGLAWASYRTAQHDDQDKGGDHVG